MKLGTLMLFLFWGTLVNLVHSDRNDKPYKVVCYYEPGQFQPEDINPFLCTHINYAFAVLENNTIRTALPTRDEGFIGDASTGQGMIRRMAALRNVNPNLTTMMAIGGWGEGSTKYSDMVTSAANRRVFIESVLTFLTEYDLDGLDFDWEYPGYFGKGSGGRSRARTSDKQNFVILLRELKEAFAPYGYLLTAAVSARKHQCDWAYDIPGLNENLDFINLMTYDYVGQVMPRTGFNSPLNANLASVQYWIDNGAEPEKIVLGIPLYGYSYLLSDSEEFGLNAEVAGPADINGNYGNICQVINESGWTVHWDSKEQVPYAVNGEKWITFDNVKSILYKLDLLLRKGLGGSMVWSVGLDDTKGQCGDGKFPLMKLQMSVLNKINVPDFNVGVPEVYRNLFYSYPPDRIYPRW